MPGIITTKFTPSDWNDGTRLSMLVNSIQPGLIPDADSLNPEDALRNTHTALKLAEQQLGIPQVIILLIIIGYKYIYYTLVTAQRLSYALTISYMII